MDLYHKFQQTCMDHKPVRQFKTSYFRLIITIKCHSRLNTKNVYENSPRYRFEARIHIHAQIQLNTILNLRTKNLLFINKDNLYLHAKFFQRNYFQVLVWRHFLVWREVVIWWHFLVVSHQSIILCLTMATFQLDEYPWQNNFSNQIKLEML